MQGSKHGASEFPSGAKFDERVLSESKINLNVSHPLGEALLARHDIKGKYPLIKEEKRRLAIF
jgi:hypothetical protein